MILNQRAVAQTWAASAIYGAAKKRFSLQSTVQLFDHMVAVVTQSHGEQKVGNKCYLSKHVLLLSMV